LYRDVNVRGTEHLLEAAAAAGVERFIHCSTVGVHGNVVEIPCSENSPLNPDDIYQETKLDRELRVRAAIDMTTGRHLSARENLRPW
jgi:nucleoside-diphosphate-sugar epimerase